MSFASLARFFRRRRRDGGAQRRLQRRRSSRRVQAVTTVNGVVQVSDMEDTSVEFDMRSTRSMSSSFYFTCSARTDRLGRDPAEISMKSMRSFRQVDPIEVVKNDQKKLRKALKRAVKQERTEAHKMKKIAEKAGKSMRKRGSSSKRIALLSAGTVSNCSVTSDLEILAEIWAMRPSSSDEVMPEVDEFADTQPMEFLFFTGSPDDKNLRELDVGYRRLRTNSRATRYPPTPSYATTVPVKPTLVTNMPPLFTPHL